MIEVTDAQGLRHSLHPDDIRHVMEVLPHHTTPMVRARIVTPNGSEVEVRESYGKIVRELNVLRNGSYGGSA